MPRKKGGPLLKQDHLNRDTSTTASVSAPEEPPWKPLLHASLLSPPYRHPQQKSEPFYYVAFYPFTAPGEQPILAICRRLEVLVLRITKSGLEVLHMWKDSDILTSESDGEELCSLCWAQDVTGGPLLLVAGLPLLSIQGLGPYDRTAGHDAHWPRRRNPRAQNVPNEPSLIASASGDNAVRIWSLDPKHRKQPCAAILGGIEGHREIVFAIAWHRSGKYILSGGMDSVVNLWSIPQLPDAQTGTDNPTMIYFPHFSSMDIHSNYIDSLFFLGDQILSKAAVNGEIILWKIVNFDSSLSPPPQPTSTRQLDRKHTRSAFGDTGYERITRFACHDTDLYFMRFDVSLSPIVDSILAMGTQSGKILLWNLTDISKQPVTLTQEGVENILFYNDDFLFSSESASDHELSSSGDEKIVTAEPARSKLGSKKGQKKSKSQPARTKNTVYEGLFESKHLTDPFSLLIPQATLKFPVETLSADDKKKCFIRCCAWSPDGTWLAAVSEFGGLAVYKVPL